MKKPTAKQEAAIIRARVDAYYETGMTYEEFTAGQRESWARVESRSPYFKDRVCALVAGRVGD